MRPLTIADAPMAVLALQDEIRRTDESRYDHRLHAVLLVAQGMTCRQAAAVLGDAPRTLEYWVRGFERDGLAGLHEGSRPGRPRRLTEEQLKAIGQVLRNPPEDVGLTANLWDGKALCAFLRREFGVDLGVRQCQRLFKSLGFRLRKPRPQIAHADAALQSAHKKNSKP
jgi:transposase